MTPEHERAFALLHFLRALAAVEEEHQACERSVERRRGYLAAGDETWGPIPTGEETLARSVATVAPPVGSDARAEVPAAEVASWFGARAVRLLHVATGATRHINDPVGWMSSRGWVAYAHVGEERVWWRATMPDAWRLYLRDPYARAAFYECALDAWEEYLVAHEWERAAEREGQHPRSPTATHRSMRAPSGKVYPLWACSGVGNDSTPAIDVALARGGFDPAAELVRGDAAISALVERAKAAAPPKATKRGAKPRGDR